MQGNDDTNRDGTAQQSSDADANKNEGTPTSRKMTFRSLLISEHQMPHPPVASTGETIEDIQNETKHLKERNDQALEDQVHSEDFSIDVRPGAVRIAVGRPITSDQEMDEGISPNASREELLVESSRSNTLSQNAIEAELVPETPDINSIVREILTREMDERISQEVRARQRVDGNPVVAAEVITPAKICNIPRNICFGFLGIALIAAVAIGVAVGVLHSKNSSTAATTVPMSQSPKGSHIAATTTPTTTLTAAPTVMLRRFPTALPTARRTNTPAPTRPLTLLQDYILNATSRGATISSLISSDVSSNPLTGPIPTEIGALTRLTNLDLKTNQLTGTIPTEIGSLTRLTNLNLYMNRLSGTIPSEIGSLTRLTNLNLYTNQFTGMVPTQLGSLARLTHLDWSSNLLTGTIPTEVGSLQILTYFDFDSNLLRGSIPSEVGYLRDLNTLYLFNNSLTGPIPSEIGLLSVSSLDTWDSAGTCESGTDDSFCPSPFS